MLLAALDCISEGYQVVVVGADSRQADDLKNSMRRLLPQSKLSLKLDNSALGAVPDPLSSAYFVSISEPLFGFQWQGYGRDQPFVFIDHHAQEQIAKDWITRAIWRR